ncbi:hypothetical protein Acor_64410 [Acrocarpospora corrugata]|uniref:Glycosyltransferase RgtA/B/C/D-like domain-containing protein n=1 Tax=Acrocarpospora corrugata TaxID=35763 RepID=A0A5M3WB33_9ACTN|nr:hypothetical protein [Acrocarpospora corrugata]GES04373.1 hypothetical protein Acor_64410 [Acrocarpospora corrugata]
MTSRTRISPPDTTADDHELGEHDHSREWSPEQDQDFGRSRCVDDHELGTARSGLIRLRSHRARRGRRSALITAILTGLAWAGVMLARLFAGGPVGVGDQGDGRRLLCTFGAANGRPWNADTSDYVFTAWVPHAWFGETCELYRSTQLGLLWLAKQVNGPLGLPGLVDLRGLGVLSTLLVGVIVGLLAWLLPGRWWVRAGAASAIGLVYADAAFAGFFVSPHTEPAALLGVGFLLAALLLLGRGATLPRLLLTTIVAIFTIGAQVQTAALAVPVCVALIWLPYRRLVRWRWAGPVLRRIPGIVLSLVVIAAASFHLAAQPETQMEAARHGVVFGSILYGNTGAAKDLQDLGFDAPSAAAISEIAATNAGVGSLPPVLVAMFKENVTTAGIVAFYLTHPAHAVRAVGWGLEGIGRFSVDYLGSYPPDAGLPPGAREHRIAAYSWFWGTFRVAPAFLLLLWVATFAAGRSVVRRRRVKPARKAVGRLAMLVPLMIVAQFGAVLILLGRADITRHLTVVSFLTAVCIPLLTLALCIRFRGVRPNPRRRDAPGMPNSCKPELVR